MTSIADIFSSAAINFFGNWEFLALLVVLLAFAIFLAQSKSGSPAAIVIMFILAYALSLLGEPWVGFLYAIVLVAGAVIARAILQFGKE